MLQSHSFFMSSKWDVLCKGKGKTRGVFWMAESGSYSRNLNSRTLSWCWQSPFQPHLIVLIKTHLIFLIKSKAPYPLHQNPEAEPFLSELRHNLRHGSRGFFEKMASM